MSYSRFGELLKNAEEANARLERDAERLQAPLRALASDYVDGPIAGYSSNEESSEAYITEAVREMTKLLEWDTELDPEVADALAGMFERIDAGDDVDELVRDTAREIAGIPLEIAKVWSERGLIVETADGPLEAIDLQEGDDESVKVRFWHDAWPQRAKRRNVRRPKVG